ncbi:MULTISPECIES: 5-carboxymethyl-2-hydroxymuconate Delta-isomerase [unclassified Virgibacillus]|uniref:5-carboxymethyl-2-hydroxymuconate Delta-isomerase n=1 Tax=unclassified Virgibacillus TaxID=2620237 RepID=UPI00090C225D|nr:MULTISPECIES: 5-carboxymethyl-2-hydroxymuconate Delta-isomerase [unclassified Virgibacillus]API93621.1 5-carboxymethyl-2-hydroxymuconate isomerase [Virgibacillus sp. 6R]MBS7429986.1 5-carboxymethyl-2-hydroxymuconate Delta-isomerase [Virgibacillus sp. 19R1-5]
MPHLIIEYTTNIRKEIDIANLLKIANQALLSHHDIIPIGGLRSRAIALEDYLIADGTEDDAFIHATLKLGKGRTETEKKRLCDDLFTAMTDHLTSVFKARYLAISLELYEFTFPTYKLNNIHQRYPR